MRGKLAAATLLRDPEPLLRARRDGLRARRDALAAAVRATLPAWRFAVPAGGLALGGGRDAPRSSALAAVADRHGVRVAAGPRFGVDGAFERRVPLPFKLPQPVLAHAGARLAT